MRHLSMVILWAVAILAVVFPNASHWGLAVFLVMGAMIWFGSIGRMPRQLVYVFILISLITVIYVFVGVLSGAPDIALVHALVTYIVSPLLWVMVLDLAIKRWGADRIAFALSVLAVPAASVIFLYYLVYNIWGPDLLSYLGSNINLHVQSDYAGIISHTAGSLIFLTAALIASPKVIAKSVLIFPVLFFIIVATFISGRTAAVLAVLIGVFFYLFSNYRSIPVKLIYLTMFGGAVLFGGSIFLKMWLEVDVFLLLERHITRVGAGLDLARSEQIAALWAGAVDHAFLGAGHGIGVELVRSEMFPWRYESVYFSLLYKVGAIGFLLIIMPLLYAALCFLRLLARGQAHDLDVFFGAGFVAVLIAGVTNAYMEAVSFQWMYILPAYYFFLRCGWRRTELGRLEAEVPWGVRAGRYSLAEGHVSFRGLDAAGHVGVRDIWHVPRKVVERDGDE